eukprot:6458756-Amphidinium_carterae.1
MGTFWKERDAKQAHVRELVHVSKTNVNDAGLVVFCGDTQRLAAAGHRLVRLCALCSLILPQNPNSHSTSQTSTGTKECAS